MENVSHTLCGLALARCGLGRVDPLATAALAIGANLPDIDLVVWLWDRKEGYMLTHRGFTHALAGNVLLGGALALVLVAAGRRLGHASRLGPLFLAAAAGCLSHLVLDWLNTYGVRPWAPFDYARHHLDAIFIVEPVFWVLFGLAALSRAPARARALTAAAALYVALQASLAAAAVERGQAFVEATSGGERVVAASAHPRPLAPWRFVALVETDERFRYVGVDFARGVVEPRLDVERRVVDPALDSIRDTRAYRAWRFFARHPFVARDGDRLILGDARYNPRPVVDWCSMGVPIPVDLEGR